MPTAQPTMSRRPPPVTRRGRRSRALIIEAAATLMYQHGVSSTSLDDVLAAAGSGKSQLYHYFENKSDLVAAVIERQLEIVLEYEQPFLDRTDSWKGIERWAQHILKMHEAPGGPFACPLGTMAAELKNDAAFRPCLDAAFRRWEEPLARGLEAMKARGELVKNAQPARLAAMVIAALQGGMLLARIRGDATVLRDAMGIAIGELRRWAVPPLEVA